MKPDSEVPAILYVLTGVGMMFMGACALLVGNLEAFTILLDWPGELVMNVLGVGLGVAGFLVVRSTLNNPPK